MPATVKRIELEVARSILTERFGVLPPEVLPVEVSLGRLLLEDVVAERSLPPHAVSAMDGYAVRAADLKSATEVFPEGLKISGWAKPGEGEAMQVRPGECARVLTGAYLPVGADAVVPQEEVNVEGGKAWFRRPVEAGMNLQEVGSDVRKGQLLFRRGHILTARDVSFLSAFGLEAVTVAPRLRVGVLATGSELVSRREEMGPGKVLESNRSVIGDLLARLGFEVEDLGIAPDDVTKIARVIDGAANRCHALVTTGGSSVSEADVVPEAVESLGGERLFHGLKLKPARTAGAMSLRNRPVFVLSGLIQAGVSAVCNVVLPLLRHVQGLGWLELPHVTARLSEDVPVSGGPGYRRVVWVKIDVDEGSLVARPLRAPSPSRYVISVMDGFVVTEPDQGLSGGDLVKVHLPYCPG